MSYLNALERLHDAQRTRARKQERESKRKAFEICDVLDADCFNMQFEHVSMRDVRS